MISPIQLPYPMDALEPYYSKETMVLHYNELYKGYITNTNKVQEQLNNARQTGNFDNIKCLEKNLSFFGSGVILHELFFLNMGPAIPTSPCDSLAKQIIKDFGSFDTFKKQFIAAAVAVEASGWSLLVWDDRFGKLEILQCEKHQNLTLWGCIPLLVLDMWEHSYYLQYKTKRNEYVDQVWNVLNWNTVNTRWQNVP